MRKHVVIAAVALVVAGTSFAVAQQFRGDRDEPGRFHQRWQPSADDIAAFADARIAGMKAGLRLNADQEKNWPAFEEAYRGLAKQRAERLAARQNEPPRSGDIVAFMQRRAEVMTRRAAGFKQLADAASPLYQSLDDAQKRRFTVLARMLRPQPMFSHGRGQGRDQMGPREFRRHERGGNFERPRFGEERRFDMTPFRTGVEDEDLFQDRADELEFANLENEAPQPEAR
jgi:zinc resistance-associated protein